ncbi:MAG: tetratricopeptide repeat protein, partial [Planctomycetaceae bacterium]|nr:tetratricopeptide repeat protein [Planctomycetaceae bacterium]
MSNGQPIAGNLRTRRIAIASAIGLTIVVVGWSLWPPSPNEQFRAGWQALVSADLRRVDALATALSQRRGFESHAHLLRGGYLLRLGRPRESLEELRQALDQDETQVRAQVLAGEALATLHQSLRATEVLREALAKDPDNIEAHRWAGVAYYDLGAMEPAVHHLERLAKLAPSDPRPHRVMGLIYKDLENDQLAVNCYQESLTRSADQPDVESIRTELAEVQIRLNRHAPAKDTLSLCSPSPRVLALRAECESALGNQSTANDLLAAAIKQDPHDATALLLQGTFALNDGQLQRAIVAFQKVIKQNPTDFTARFKLSRAFAQSGDEPRAAEQLAAMNQIKDIRREANEVYQQALGHPRDAEARFRRGSLSEKLHRPDLAR